MTLNQKLSENLEKLEQSLADVLQASSSLDGRKPWKSRTIAAVRKLRIMRELNQRYYIAITGTQGAGKTRLIRSLYELDTTWLADNVGRGEKTPVFIIEKDGIKEPEGAVLRIVDDGRVEEVSVESAGFRESVTSWSDDGKNLFPLLYVPRKYFNGVAAGFVLLPGFEREDANNRIWQRIMTYVLEYASGSVIVTDQTRLADDSQDRVREVAISDKALGHKPVVAISKTENVDALGREKLRRRAAERFDVDPVESDRIICIGVGERVWVDELMRAVEKYVMLGLDLTATRLNSLDEVVDGEIYDIHDEIQERLREDIFGTDPNEENRERLLGMFRKASDEYRRTYEKQLGQRTRTYAGKAKEKARKLYQDDEEGFQNGVKSIARWISTTSGERENIHVKRIQNCWMNPEKNPNGIALLKSDWQVLSSQSARYLKIPLDETRTGETDDVSVLLGYGELDAQGKLAGLLEPAVISELHKLFHFDSSTKGDADPLKNERLGDVLKLVPALTMEYLRINQGLLLTHQDHLPMQPTARPLGEFMTELATDLPAVNNTAKTLLRTIGAILAVDVAIDGTIDTVPGLIHAIIGGTTATAVGSGAATVGATLSMAAAGFIVVGVIGYKITQHVQQMDAAHRGYINVVIDQMAEAHVLHCLDVYDDSMELLMSRIYDNLGRAYGLNQKVSSTDNLLRALTRLKRAQLSALGGLRAKQLLA